MNRARITLVMMRRIDTVKIGQVIRGTFTRTILTQRDPRSEPDQGPLELGQPAFW